MAAVAAASAELLIIGWYIFRVLLQVSVWELQVEEGSQCAHPDPTNPASRLPPPEPILSRLPRSLSAPVPLRHRAPLARSLRPPPRADPPQCARARPGTKTRGAADDR